MRPVAGVCLAVFLLAPPLRADGGKIRVRQESGPFVITVLTSPDPLAAGRAEISVLVERAGAVALDAEVEVRLRGEGDAEEKSYAASRERSSNRLYQSTRLELSHPGDWELRVTARQGFEEGEVRCRLPVAPPQGRAAAAWPYLLPVPLAILLFAARETLVSRGRRRDRLMSGDNS
jgi:hypothetical protein